MVRRCRMRSAGEGRDQGDHPVAPTREEGCGRFSLRGLREGRARHRGFRPGVLILILAALAGCSGRAPDFTGTDAVYWLQLQKGAFQPVAGPWSAVRVTLEPWTGQGQPYQNSQEMAQDARNGHLYFFTGGDFPKDHLLQITLVAPLFISFNFKNLF